MADVDANRVAQREIYGEPLGAIVDRCRGTLGLTQARVAALLGISAPMLSQVMSGQRIKIGNPAAVERLRAMVEATDAVAGGRLTVAEAIARIESADGARELLTGGTTRRSSASETAEQIQGLFRRVASASDYLAAADRIDDTHPGIARLLRVYGTGRSDEATAHLLGQQ